MHRGEHCLKSVAVLGVDYPGNMSSYSWLLGIGNGNNTEVCRLLTVLLFKAVIKRSLRIALKETLACGLNWDEMFLHWRYIRSEDGWEIYQEGE
ncbi:hypothetical protein KQX54_008914 [Cotesia glomerata]|uniref:Uncharacterized protein n=1 Tax=Cotesia glomerata TaxID=32391 RepID=A0AAV7J2J7_COTGL|nr:hypothetical protein KQX54_008914 [Cotesia glomerata]